MDGSVLLYNSVVLSKPKNGFEELGFSVKLLESPNLVRFEIELLVGGCN